MANAETEVECPICGGTFDPTAAGGWCTNPDCGEWQYEGDAEADESAETRADERAEEETEARDDAEASAADDFFEEADQLGSAADDSGAAADDDPETTAADEELDAEDDAPPEKAAVDAGDEPGPTEAEETDTTDGPEPGEEADSSADDDVGTAEAEDTADEEGTDGPESPTAPEGSEDDPATISCPDCGTELDADANFCIECGADVQDVEPGTDELTACPSCGTDLEGDEHFCANCGEDLDAHREDTTEASDPDAVEALAAQTDEEDAPVPESLVLSVLGTEIVVEDGDRVGREVRAALTDAGRPEDEAVRIHREHVRFVREADSFYLVDLGDNPTTLNGQSLKKGDREPVGPGDELELSGVATVAIESP